MTKAFTVRSDAEGFLGVFEVETEAAALDAAACTGFFTGFDDLVAEFQGTKTREEVAALFKVEAAIPFDSFQASARRCDNLNEALAYDGDAVDRGNLYLGSLYIVDRGEGAERGRYSLMLFRDEETSDDLPHLERMLWEWAAAEGYLDPSGWEQSIAAPSTVAGAPDQGKG